MEKVERRSVAVSMKGFVPAWTKVPPVSTRSVGTGSGRGTLAGGAATVTRDGAVGPWAPLLPKPPAPWATPRALPTRPPTSLSLDFLLFDSFIRRDSAGLASRSSLTTAERLSSLAGVLGAGVGTEASASSAAGSGAGCGASVDVDVVATLSEVTPPVGARSAAESRGLEEAQLTPAAAAHMSKNRAGTRNIEASKSQRWW